MDLDKFISERLEPGDFIGLYCVSQKLLKPPFERNVFRCGAAGTKEVIDRGFGTGGQSSFRSRMAMYLSNWISGGLLHMCLTVPRSVFAGFSQRVLQQRDPRDGREDYALSGKTRLQLRERQYHNAIEARGVQRVRTKAEWFRGSLRQIEAALKSINTGTFYRFENDAIVEKVELKGGADLNVTQHSHRRSPRLVVDEIVTVKPAKRASPRLREALTSPRIAAQIAEVASRSSDIARIKLTRKDLGPPSRRLRSSRRALF